MRGLQTLDAPLGHRLAFGAGGVLDQGAGVLQLGVIRHGQRPLGHSHHGEGRPVGAAPLNLVRDRVHRVRNLRQQNDIRPTCDAGAQGQPAGPVPHDLGEDDAVMGVGRRVQAVHGLGGDLQSRGEAEGGVGVDDVVVDGLGQVDDVQASIHEAFGVLRGPSPAEADQGVDPVLLTVVHDGRHHVPELAVHHHPMNLVPAGSQHGSAGSEDPGQGSGVELSEAVLGQAAHAVPEADELPAVLLDRRLSEASDRRVESRGVAARRENTDALSHEAKYAGPRWSAQAVGAGSADSGDARQAGR